jgi:uncharacterized protein
MKPREFDPRKLDIKAFAKVGGQLTGAWPVATFARLASTLAAGDGGAPVDAVTWSATGHEVPVRGGAAQIWLHLHAEAALPMVCQRCLLAYPHPMSVAARIQFVADEAIAADIDADAEHDVLVISKELDLHELVEDELLLALPLVPRHDACPQPLTASVAEEAEVPRQHPFAALAVLRAGKP